MPNNSVQLQRFLKPPKKPNKFTRFYQNGHQLRNLINGGFAKHVTVVDPDRGFMITPPQSMNPRSRLPGPRIRDHISEDQESMIMSPQNTNLRSRLPDHETMITSLQTTNP
ncbi:Hypothetical protein NTJ_11541 [Nesidiocoris tenuis]|uniref:Uncharacterized protein n=1 Tax=Nesidiocoris tenuis TaxID=355587 RepID=A0ABN7B2T5_9HEMI|nr:Hypothetical protein NTJ_11541 [Nesidiocoris tenuis]